MNRFEFNYIQPSLAIGDSISAINLNYSNLDEWTSNIALSAELYWKPMLAVYSQLKNNWKEGLSLLQQYSANWISVKSTVESCSAKWLEPLTLIYPDFFTRNQVISNADYVKNTLTTWLNQKFPVLVERNERPFYIENQEAIVHYFLQFSDKEIVENHLLRASTKCLTQDQNMIVKCVEALDGIAFCSNGDMNCAGHTLESVGKEYIECYFNGVSGAQPLSGENPTGPYVNVVNAVNSSAEGAIQSNLTVVFNDIRESSSLNGIKFKVKNCQWEFVELLSSPASVKENFQTVFTTQPPTQFSGVDVSVADIKGLTSYLPMGDQLSWIVPKTVSKIKITVSGPGGSGGTGAAVSPRLPKKGGSVIIQDNHSVGQDGTDAEYIKPISQGGLGRVPQGGTGYAGGGGGATEETTTSVQGWGAGGGGGGGWCQKTLDVEEGQVFIYSCGIPGIESKISRDNWFISASPGGAGSVGGYSRISGTTITYPSISGGLGGRPFGTFDIGLTGLQGKTAENVDGANGAMGYGLGGANDLVSYGAYIHIEIVETIGAIVVGG